MARDLGVDMFTAVSWRGVRLSGVLKGCNDGKVACDTNVCTSESRRRAWMHVKDVRPRRETLTLLLPSTRSRAHLMLLMLLAQVSSNGNEIHSYEADMWYLQVICTHNVLSKDVDRP